MAFRLLLLALATVGLVALPQAASAAEEAGSAPALVLRIQSIEGLVADLKYLGGLAGQPDAAEQAEGVIKSQISDKGLNGIDVKKPLGAYGFISPNLQDSSAVVLLPLVDEKPLIDFIQNFGVEAKKEKDGVYTIRQGNLPFALYMRVANGYGYLTARDKAALDKDKLLAPDKVLAGSSAEVLSGRFRLDQLPDVLKQIIVGQIELRMEEAREKKEPNETEAQRAMRQQTIKEMTKVMTSLFTEGGSLALKLNVDRKRDVLSFETTLSGQKNSALAKQIEAMGRSKSEFGGLSGKDSAMSGLFHAALPEELRSSLYSVFIEGFKKEIAKEKDANKRKQAELLVKALEPSIKAGELDLGVDLRGPDADGKYTLVAGTKVKEGQQLEKTLREMVKQLPEKERNAVKLDTGTVKNVKIHSITPKDGDANAKRVFGDGPVYVAFRDDAALLTYGAKALDAMKATIALEPSASRQMQFEIAFGRIGNLDEKNPAMAKFAKEVFTGKNEGRDKLRIQIEGGEALKFRLELQGPVVTFFSKVGQAGKKG